MRGCRGRRPVLVEFGVVSISVHATGTSDEVEQHVLVRGEFRGLETRKRLVDGQHGIGVRGTGRAAASRRRGPRHHRAGDALVDPD